VMRAWFAEGSDRDEGLGFDQISCLNEVNLKGGRVKLVGCPGIRPDVGFVDRKEGGFYAS